MRESTIANEWKAEGKMEGKLEAERDTLLRLVNLKFQTPLPEDFTTAVERQRDLSVLARWFAQAVLASSLEDLLKAIRPL